MSGWRFYPLRDHPKVGVLVTPSEVVAARFLTPEQARNEARFVKSAA